MIGLESLIAFVLLIVSAAVQSSPVYSSVGDKRDFNREFMHFGKRAAGNFYELDDGDFNRAFMPFGKRDFPLDEIVASKKNFDREFMHFGKRSSAGEPFGREFMHFGKRR